MKPTVLAIIIALTSLAADEAVAETFTEELARCLVRSTTESDRNAFVRWMFAAISVHPAVASFADLSADEIMEVNLAMAGLFEKLLTESCKTEAAEAFRVEGQDALEGSFNVLGQIAGQEMFAHPAVTAATAGMATLMNMERIGEVLGINAE